MFGGSAIEEPLLAAMRSLVPFNSRILEFGSGDGTDELLKYFRVVSVEHNRKYCTDRTENHRCHHIALFNGWYDAWKVKKLFRKPYDLILVDGPPKNRWGILDNLWLFNGVSVPFIFDDVNRPSDFEVMERFCARQDYTFQVINGVDKQFAICKK